MAGATDPGAPAGAETELAPIGGDVPAEPVPAPRLARNSAIRFLADASGILLGTISTVVTARVLGPADKGTLSALTFVTIILTQGSSLGLGDAAAVRIGQGRSSAQEALSTSLGVMLVATVGALALLGGYAALQLPLDQHSVAVAVAIAGATLFVSGIAQMLLWIVYARQQVEVVSWTIILMAASTTALTVLLCALLPLRILGATLAMLGGALVGTAIAATMLWSRGLHPRPAWRSDYIRPALRFGVRTQVANLLAFSSARFDLLLVYALSTSAAAGNYAIALTVGSFTSFVAIALAYAAFPRITRLSAPDGLRLSAQLVRTGFLVAAAVGIAISAAVPTMVHVLLGEEYSAAITPSLILLGANVLWGAQWILSRAMAATGDPSLLLRSFGLNVGTMVVADILLIPPHGAVGAALAALLAAVVGLVVCVAAYRRRGIGPEHLLPRASDGKNLATIVREAVRGGRGAVRGSSSASR